MANPHAPPPSSFLNYPTPKAYSIPPAQSRTEPQNPVLKGRALSILASVVTTVPFLPAFLYTNAGFAELRGLKELEGVEPRFDPAVVKVRVDGVEEGEVDRRIEEEVGSQLPAVFGEGGKGLGKERFYSISDFNSAYREARVTPSDVVEALLPLIRRDVAERSDHATAFMDSKIEVVRRAAEESSKRWREGKPLGVLDGVPFAVKDEMDVRGYKRYLGTKRDYSNGGAGETSWCVGMLEREGAVCVGKTGMHELGMDTTNNNPIWGTPLNPYNNGYYTGGSSGGSAYAVASGLVPFAVGADGGGSIRIPSSFCGLYGLKPSHGRVSISPTICFENSTVVHGPLAANMLDLSTSYRVLAQPDPSHSLSRQFAFSSIPSALKPNRNGRKLLGICKPWLDRADPVVQEKCEDALRYLTTELDYEIVEIDIPLLREGQLAHAMTILAECVSSNPDIASLTPANKILMSVAKQTPATDLLLAQRLRNLLMQHLASLFQTYPGLIIVTPTTPNAGWKIGDGELVNGMTDGNTQMRSMEYVWLANFTGVPCITFPVGYAEGNVPVGMCGHGEWGAEEELIAFGFDGERWLNNPEEGVKGGRRMPGGGRWVDVMGTAEGQKAR